MFSFNTLAVSFSSHYLDSSLQRINQAKSKIASGKSTVGNDIDTGGISLSVKLNAQAANLVVVNGNIQNAISFLEVQEGYMSQAEEIFGKVIELFSSYTDDPLLSDNSINSYDNEFRNLQLDLLNIANAKFNGVELFADLDNFGQGGDEVLVNVSPSNSQSIVIKREDLNYALGYTIFTGTSSLANLSQGMLDVDLADFSNVRSHNLKSKNQLLGYQQSLNQFRLNSSNALSRATDVDLASELSQIAKHTILQNSATSMIVQANTSTEIAATLLG
jgi:flagellin